MDVNDPATTQTSTTVKLTPPDGGPFDKFILTVCRVGAQPADCKDFTCAPAQVAACPITGLTDNTSYTVTAVAVKGADTSAAGGPDTFSTLPYP